MADILRPESPWHLKLRWPGSKGTRSPRGTGTQSPLGSGAQSPRGSGTQSPRRSPSPSPSQSPAPHAASAKRAMNAANLAAGVKNLLYDFTVNIPTNIPYPPFVNIQGVPNFRDLGGYACQPKLTQATDHASEHSLRTGFAFRCSELSQITPAGLYNMVEVHHITTLFDLRGEREFESIGNRFKSIKCISTPVFRGSDVYPGMAAQQLRWSTMPDKPGAGYSQGYVDWYRQIAIYGANYAYKIIFEHIRDKPERPFVFHCSAGKDRTGVLSAIILRLCGVDNQTIAWEYALTVPGMGVWEAAVEQEMVGDSMMPIRSHDGMTAEEARRVCGSRASNMLRWLEVVLDGEFGGPVKYLKKYCRFREKDIETITKNLVTAAKPTVKVVEVPGMQDHPQT